VVEPNKCVQGAIIIVWAIFFNFFSLFLCDPIAQQWTVERVGKCMDQMLLLKVLILTNLVTDLVLVVLPIRCVWQLQMRKTEKFAVLACFGMGMACVIIGIARFIFVCTIGTSPISFFRKQKKGKKNQHLNRPRRQRHGHIDHNIHALHRRAYVGRYLHQSPHAPPLLSQAALQVQEFILER
jgi:hypothetical protein